MIIEKFEKDMNIIGVLPDEPNDVGGMPSNNLKAKFDEGGIALQKYINEVLIPFLNDFSVTGGGGGHVILDKLGNAMTQRSRLMFMGDVSDDGVTTIVEFTPDDIGAARAAHKHSTSDITTGVLGLAYGGTGGSTASAARKSLGVPTITYGTADPSGGSEGDIYFKII